MHAWARYDRIGMIVISVAFQRLRGYMSLTVQGFGGNALTTFELQLSYTLVTQA